MRGIGRHGEGARARRAGRCGLLCAALAAVAVPASGEPQPAAAAAAPQPTAPAPATAAPKAAPKAAPAPAAAAAAPPAAAPPAQVPPVPQVPPPEQAAPNLGQDFANLDVGGLREAWANTPSFIGDGCAPSSVASDLVVGRLVVVAPGLLDDGGVLFGGETTAVIGTVPGALGSVQAIQAAGYPAFILPIQQIDTVPSTPPTQIATAGPAVGGITPLVSPAPFTAAVDNAFATSPALDTSQYAAQNPTTVYDAASSGALASSGTSGFGPQDAFLFYNYSIKVDSLALIPGLNVGFVKLVENTSPIPRDRVYFNYSYFHNANISAERADVNRFVPGFEKTFFDRWTSIEVRTPFAATLSNTQQVQGGACGGLSEYRDIEFGNMSVIFKSFLMQRETWGITGGMQVLLPTADSTFVKGTNQNGLPTQFVYVENQSVHTMPFVGSVWAPSERWFNQAMIQMDVDTNGSPAYVNSQLRPGITNKQLDSAGRILVPTFMYLSFSTGYWLYQGDGPGLTGFSPMMEVHVNQGMTQFQPLNAYGYTLGNDLGVVSVTNGLVGCNFEYNKRSTMTFAYVTPLGGGFDRFFDGEFRAFVNWRFGPQNRLTRAQF